MSADTYRTASGVRVRQEDEDRFIFYWDERGYEGNATTASIVQACQAGCTIDQVVARICKEFEIDPNTAKTDIEEIVQQLMETGILVNQSQGGDK